MSTFRDVSTLSPDALRSETHDSVNSGQNRDAEECKCGDADVPGRFLTDEKSNKLPHLVNVNQQLTEENELMRQCIIRLMENADLRSMNALTMVMSQTDERLRHFISDSVTGSNPRDKASTSHDARYNTQYQQLPTSHPVTHDSRSYGSSFKEIRLSELDHDPVAMVTSAPKMINSNKYTQQTSQNKWSPNKTYQSYGKSFKEINLSELDDESQLAHSNEARVRTKQHPSMLKEDMDATAFRSYDKSTNTLHQSGVNNNPYYTRSNDLSANRKPPMESQNYSKASNDSYGKSFQKISLRELYDESELPGPSNNPRQAKFENVKSPKSQGSVLNNSSHHVVLQPPMKFGMGMSPYQKSPVSPVPQKPNKSPLPQTANRQPLVNKRRSTNSRRRRYTNSPYYSEHQSLIRTPTVSSSLKQRPRSSPLTSSDARFRKINKPRYPDDNVPPSFNVLRDTEVSLPELLKHLLEAEKYKTRRGNTREFCMDCTNTTCKCHLNPNIKIVNERRLNVSRESFSNDSLDRTIEPKSRQHMSSVDETSKGETIAQVNGCADAKSYVSKPIPTINITPCPIFCSTQLPQNVNEEALCISPGNPQTDPVFWEQNAQRYGQIMDHVTERQSKGRHETYALTSVGLQSLAQNRNHPNSYDYDHNQTTTTNKDDFDRTLVNERDDHVVRSKDNGLVSQNQNIDKIIPNRNKGPQHMGTDVKQQLIKRTNFDQNSERQPNANIDLQFHKMQQSLQSSHKAEIQPSRNGEMPPRNIATNEYVDSVAQEPNADLAMRRTRDHSGHIVEQSNGSMERSTDDAQIYRNEVKSKMNEHVVNSKVEEQPYKIRGRTAFGQSDGQPTIHKDMGLVKTAKHFDQTTSDGIGSPMAFSTPNYQSEQIGILTQKESVQGNNLKDNKATTSRNVTESQPPTSYAITSDSGSYGASFKEVRLSDLAEDPVTRATNVPIIHSNSYTEQTPDFGAPNKASLQSYGKSIKDIKLSDLNNGTHLASLNGTSIRTNQNPPLLQSKVDSNAPFRKHEEQSSTNKGHAMVTSGKTINQPESDAICSPIAFSTPKDHADQKMTHYSKKGRILENNSKGKVTASLNVQPTGSQPSASHTITSDPGSYGVSFKEVRLSDLAENPVTRATNAQNIIHSNSYTAQTPDYDSSNKASLQSYGKSAKDIKLIDLNNETHSASLNRTSIETNQQPPLLQSKVDSNANIGPHAGQSPTNKYIVTTDNRFNQPQSDVIDSPIAFSTPKDHVDQKMTPHGQKESILENNSKGKATASQNVQPTESQPSASHTITSDSGSNGISFKEVRLSELAEDPVTKATNTHNTSIIHSNSYTAQTPEHGSTNKESLQSYGKQFKEINLSDLNNGPYLNGARVRANVHPSLLKSKEDSDTPASQSRDTWTTNKDTGMDQTDQTFNQTQPDAFGRPLAFSTPKDTPHQKMNRHARKETSPTTLKPLKLLATSAVEQVGTNDSTQKQSRVSKADGKSTNDVHAAKDEKAEDGVPKGEIVSALPNSENEQHIEQIDTLAKTMRFTGTARAKYVLHRAIDTLLGYRPNLQYTASVLQTAGNLNTRLVGEISFQLDRRILEFVFDGVEEKMGTRRSRYYGYSVASILQLIDKEVKYADNNAEINKILRQRLEDVLKKLHSLGYKMEHHAEFAQDMVNQFGLLNGEPEKGSLEYLGIKEPAILRVVLGNALHNEDLDSMLVILDCLLYMAYHDRRPIFVW